MMILGWGMTTPKLTGRQRKLIKGLVDGKPQKVAAKEAGLNESYASQILKEPKVRDAFNALLDKMGLSDEMLIGKHKQLLDAQKTISVVSGKDAGANSMDFVDVPDSQVQVKALELAYKLKGSFAAEKKEIQINVSQLTDEELIAISESGG